MTFANFEEFWTFLIKELKTPKKFNTVQDKRFTAQLMENKIVFRFDYQSSRVEYKKSLENCYELYLNNAERIKFRCSHNASYVLPIFGFYLR